MRGYSAGTRKEKLQTDIANMDLRRAITRFAWKYYGSTVQCERKYIELSHLNKGSGQIFQAVENSTGTVWTKPKSFDYRLLGCEQL